MGAKKSVIRSAASKNYNCTPGIGLSSGATLSPVGLVGDHCARLRGDIGAGNMCLDASTVSEESYM